MGKDKKMSQQEGELTTLERTEGEGMVGIGLRQEWERLHSGGERKDGETAVNVGRKMDGHEQKLTEKDIEIVNGA